jgi:hypothetical protein
MADYSNNNGYSATPAAPDTYSSDYPAGGTYAQPVQTQPSVVYASGQPATSTYYVGGNAGSIYDSNGRQKPLGEWADNLCDWPKNLYPSCYCSMFCLYGMYLIAQSK